MISKYLRNARLTHSECLGNFPLRSRSFECPDSVYRFFCELSGLIVKLWSVAVVNPKKVSEDRRNGCRADAEAFSQSYPVVVPISVQLSNLLHLASGQNGHWVSLPEGLPSFGNHVTHIGSVVSNEKVCRIHARRIITAVKGEILFCERSDGKYPRCAARPNPTALLGVNVAVTHTCDRSSPQPARSKFRPVGWNWSSLVYLFPKSLREVWRKSLLREVLLSNLNLHKSVCLICAALRGLRPPGHLFSTSFCPTQSIPKAY